MSKTIDPGATLRRLAQEDYFANETFADLDLQGFDLGGKEFYRCTFQSCKLGESRWKESQLEACAFRACDLSRAEFKYTGLRGVRFEGSKLLGIDWGSLSPNPELVFEECKLRYGSFAGVNLRGTPFRRCSLVDVNFVDADLTECDFGGSDLTGSTIQGCNLTRADFREAAFVFIEPGRNRLKNTGVPVETAVLVAESLGMVVAGHGDAGTRATADRRKR